MNLAQLISPHKRPLLLLLLCSALNLQANDRDSQEEVSFWQGTPKGETSADGPESISYSIGPVGKIFVKNNVSEPTLTIYKPEKSRTNGTAMLVAPGGGFAGLAWDVEGTEVAKWLTERGFTAFLLKYRVGPFPVTPQEFFQMTLDELIPLLQPARKTAVLDAAQAIKHIRENAEQYGINPTKVGMIGFSAGAVTTLGVILEAGAESQPDFAAPIYGMTMIDNPVLPESAPPIFMTVALDDKTIPAEKSLEIFKLWHSAKIPVELHMYSKGDHGFGTRKRGLPVDNWTRAFEAWLQMNKFL